MDPVNGRALILHSPSLGEQDKQVLIAESLFDVTARPVTPGPLSARPPLGTAAVPVTVSLKRAEPPYRDISAADKPRQPGPQVLPVGLTWPRHTCPVTVSRWSKVILLPVDIQPAYDDHRDLLKPGEARTPHANCLRSQS